MVSTQSRLDQPNRIHSTATDKLTIGLVQLLRKAPLKGDADSLKECVRVRLQVTTEMELEDHIGSAAGQGAARRESISGRTG